MVVKPVRDEPARLQVLKRLSRGCGSLLRCREGSTVSSRRIFPAFLMFALDHFQHLQSKKFVEVFLPFFTKPPCLFRDPCEFDDDCRDPDPSRERHCRDEQPSDSGVRHVTIASSCSSGGACPPFP